MKKILYIISREFYPITGGREVVLYNYCKGLKEYYNAEIDLFCFGDNEQSSQSLTKLNFINKVYFAKRPNIISKLKNIFLKSFLLQKWPLQVSIYYSKKNKKKLEVLIEENKYDIVICDMARTAEYLRHISGVHKVLDMNDLISNRYFRQSESIKSESNILGQFATKLPKISVKLINSKLVAKSILKVEGKLLKKYETEIGKDFDDIIFVSYLESQQYDNLINENKSITIPIGVDYDYYSTIIKDKLDEPTLVFLGNMQIPHNKDAVDHFINDIFSYVQLEIPNVKLRIVGKCDDFYKQQMSQYDFVEVTGMVDDIRPYVQECWIAIAPLTYGSGVKTKVLETLAMGLPVVTNSIGAEGIAANECDGLFVYDDIHQFSESIIQLLSNEKKRQNLAIATCELIKSKYKWDSVLKNFSKIIK